MAASTPLIAQDSDDLAAYCAYLDVTTAGEAGEAGATSLCEALRAALAASPELKALRLGVEAGEGRLRQATLLPNPSLDATVESIGGTGESEGLSGAETTLAWNQPIELGGKRGRREGLAQAEQELTSLAFTSRRAEIVESVKDAFFAALATQATLALSERRQALAQESVAAARRRATAGSGSMLEETRTNLAFVTSQMATAQAQRDLEAAQRTLLSRLGSGAATVVLPSKSLEITPPPPAWETVEAALPRSPALQRAQLETRKRQASVLLAEANAVSDLSVSVGVKHARAAGDTSVLLGLSLPVPLFDRNQGAILEAQKDAAAGGEEERAETAATRNALKAAHQDMVAAHAMITTFKTDVIPPAEKGFAAATNAFLLGKVNYLEVVDAQRTLFDAREDFVRVLGAYHRARALAERILGQGLGQGRQ